MTNSMRHLRWSRIVAAVVLAASLTILAVDLIRTSILAREHSLTLAAELEGLPVPAGVQRLGVVRFHKPRLASVGARYGGETTRQHVFDHYRHVLEARTWRRCDDGDHTGPATVREVFCRNDYRARVDSPSAEGPGTYSVALEWNRVTFGVWLIGVALLWAAGISAVMLVRGGGLWPGHGRRGSLQLRTTLRPPECVTRLSAAAATTDMVFTSVPTTHDRTTTFGLTRRQPRFAVNAFAPYFYGRLAAAGPESGSIVNGYFGFPPETRAVGIVLIVGLTITLGFAIWDTPARDFRYALWAILVGGALIAGGVWMRRRDRREIVAVMETALGASDG
jgi:hypothetical protein